MNENPTKDLLNDQSKSLQSTMDCRATFFVRISISLVSHIVFHRILAHTQHVGNLSNLFTLAAIP